MSDDSGGHGGGQDDDHGAGGTAHETGDGAAHAPACGSCDDTGDEDAARTKRLVAAWRGARRKLSPCLQEATVGELLAPLADAPYDLDEPADVYGDGVVAALERRVAQLLGTEDAAFFPSGTMAQQVALRCWAGRTGNRAVALHPMSHPERWEGDALSAVSGLRAVHPTTEPRQPSPAEVAGVREPFGTLMLELPLRDAGFLLPTWEELGALVEAARAREAVVHFDGARLWESTVHFGRALADIAALADSVYVSFYKSLGGLSGAALAGPQDFVEETRVWRHRYGGQIFRQFPQALAALTGLERELPKLPAYVAQAREVASALREGFAQAGLPWFRIHPREPHTHQFQAWLPYDADRLTDAGLRQAEETGTVLFRRWAPAGPPDLAMTEVEVTEPGLSWTPEDVRAAAAAFAARL
ncbi:threonine aldolase [Streptomyces sp. CB00455]|uniref:threonine aldolase family protein n=1 Tax=Streptomyces sp. CB00455 TaxID=1703927 RepID=UPI00093C618E|nr:beta-eliminating lyase-related protein [Streptomyces sp. CB00455]OKK18524.1 threonine aldolase [Streptomyces sp. CB00455]